MASPNLRETQVRATDKCESLERQGTSRWQVQVPEKTRRKPVASASRGKVSANQWQVQARGKAKCKPMETTRYKPAASASPWKQQRVFSGEQVPCCLGVPVLLTSTWMWTWSRVARLVWESGIRRALALPHHFCYYLFHYSCTWSWCSTIITRGLG